MAGMAKVEAPHQEDRAKTAKDGNAQSQAEHAGLDCRSLCLPRHIAHQAKCPAGQT